MTVHPVRAVGVLPDFHPDSYEPIPLACDMGDASPTPADVILNDPLHASLPTSFVSSEETCVERNDNQLKYTLHLDDDILDRMIARFFESEPVAHRAETDVVSVDGIMSHTASQEDSTHVVMEELDINLSSSSTSHRDENAWRRATGCNKMLERSKLGIKKGRRSRAPARPWTEQEHQRFEESLELFGRNWEQCAAYIGTRRAQLVRSHAQKHLIKLWKLGKPLPKKVAESGTGYTLSGKPLLADSASARSYLTKIPCPPICEKSQ